MKGTYVDRMAPIKVSTDATETKKQKRKSGKDQAKGQNPLHPGFLTGIAAPGAVVQNIAPSSIVPPATGKIQI